MSSELWTGLYQGNADNIRRWLYGSILIRDWAADGSTDLSAFTPFDTGGDIKDTLLDPSFPGGQWYELGAISEDGVEFNPKFTTDDTKIWQDRHPQRTDVTEDGEEIMFSMAESTPIGDLLRNNLPLTNVPELGQTGYQVTQPNQTDILYRQLCVIGVDGQLADADYIAEVRPRVSMVKKGKRNFQAKKVDLNELTFGVYPDPHSGFAARTLRGGPFWSELGGPIVWAAGVTPPAATAIAGAKATIVFQQPTSANNPFTYTVSQTTASTTSAATLVGSPVINGSGQVTLTAGSLTVGSSYTFKVTVTGANGATAVSAVTSSVTAIT